MRCSSTSRGSGGGAGTGAGATAATGSAIVSRDVAQGEGEADDRLGVEEAAGGDHGGGRRGGGGGEADERLGAGGAAVGDHGGHGGGGEPLDRHVLLLDARQVGLALDQIGGEEDEGVLVGEPGRVQELGQQLVAPRLQTDLL